MKPFSKFFKKSLYTYDNLVTVFSKRFDQKTTKQIQEYMQIPATDIKKLTLRLMTLDVLEYIDGVWCRGEGELTEPKKRFKPIKPFKPITLSKKQKVGIASGITFGGLAVVAVLWVFFIATENQITDLVKFLIDTSNEILRIGI